MDGISATNLIHKFDRETPVIFMSVPGRTKLCGGMIFFW